MTSSEWKRLKLIVEMPAVDLGERDFRAIVETILRENLPAYLRRSRASSKSGRLEVKQFCMVTAAETRFRALKEAERSK